MSRSNYPDDIRPSTFEGAAGFQGDVSWRDIEVTVTLKASMVNYEVNYILDKDEIRDATAEALRKSWLRDQERKP